jgi:hypothetical protein
MHRAFAALMSALVCSLAVSCTGSEDVRHAKTLCGTPVGPELSKILPEQRHLSEWTSAGFREPGSSWCIVSVNGKKALSLWFARGGEASDLMGLAENSPVVGLTSPHAVRGIGQEAAVGRDGALVTTPCLHADGTSHLTLGLRLSHGSTVENRERDVERFMRAYMPATVKSLNCLKN